MTRLLRIIAILLFSLLLIAGLLVGIHYKSDIPPEKLVTTYAYQDSDFIEINGMKIHYRKSGKGPTLVLIHGFGGNLRHWAPWTTIFRKDYQIVSLDLPGFGLTGPHPDRIYDHKMYMEVLHTFFKRMELDSFYLGGNSMGGGMAWRYTLEYPEQVRKLILVNAAGYPRDSSDRRGLVGFKLLNTPILNQVATKITPRSIIHKTVEGVYGDYHEVTEEEVDEYMDMLRREGNRGALLDKRKADQGPGSESISNIQIPTLIMWGDKDRLISYQNAYKFERDIPNSRVIIYNGVGHVPMLEIPERSAADLYSFLAE